MLLLGEQGLAVRLSIRSITADSRRGRREGAALEPQHLSGQWLEFTSTFWSRRKRLQRLGTLLGLIQIRTCVNNLSLFQNEQE